MIERVHANPVREKQLGFCHAVRVGDLVFVSGVVSWDESFQPMHVGDMAGQMRQVYGTLERTLAGFDLGFGNVVKETAFTTDITAAFGALETRAGYFSGGLFPASSWVEVAGLAHPDLLLEVEVIAAAG
jgi:enamine deaminase RidA (YjgF/YER057c/UK114 family)